MTSDEKGDIQATALKIIALSDQGGITLNAVEMIITELVKRRGALTKPDKEGETV